MAQDDKTRSERKRKRRSMSLNTLSSVITEAVYRLEDAMETATELDDLRKCVHALATISGAFVKVKEVGELEKRLTELEKAMEARQ